MKFGMLVVVGAVARMKSIEANMADNAATPIRVKTLLSSLFIRKPAIIVRETEPATAAMALATIGP